MKKENVTGKVIIHHTIHRILELFRKNPIGFMLLIIPATLLIITEIRKIIENTKKSS